LLIHGLIAFLYGLGLALTLLEVLELSAYRVTAGGIVLAITVLCAVFSRRKWAALALTAAVVLGAVGCLTIFGGSATAVDILRAMTLQLSGLTIALPMVGRETAVLLALVCGFSAFVLTLRRSGLYLPLVVLLLATLLLWLGDRAQSLVWLLPSISATLALAMTSSQESPALRRVLPLAVGLAVIAYLVVPATGVTVPPLKEAADQLRQRILDYFFFTEPRSVFSLADKGYYPQGPNQLGGPIQPDDQPVMVVSTPKRTYLRGAVKDEYTGRVWLDTKGGQRRYQWIYPQWRSQRETLFNMGLPQGALGADEGLMKTEQVSVRMVSPSASTLFVPQRVRELRPGGDLVPYFGSSSEIFATRDLQPGDTYTVVAPLMLGGEPGLGTLVTACSANGDSQFPAILADFTQLPGHLQQELYDLALDITAKAQTPYDKACAIQIYLSRYYNYALDVEIQPANIDFVSYFLLSSREGYCTYFATAMTVLCRIAGLPARYVEGYLAEPDAGGVAHVTGEDGHAWTEVYFEGFGWLTFDATPMQNHGSTEEPDASENDPEPTVTPEEQTLPTPPPEEDQPDDEPTPSPTPRTDDAATPEPETPPQPPQEPDPEAPRLSWLWWLLLLLVAAGAAAVRILMTQPARLAVKAPDELARWSVWMQAIHDVLRVLKLPRQPSESPAVYMRRLDSLRRLNVAFTPLGECESLVFYGRLDPTPEETQMAAKAYAQLFAALPWPTKARTVILRAATPMKKRDFTR